MYYSGIDLHKDNSYITTMDGKGKIIKQERMVNDKGLIVDYFKSIGRKHRSVVETTSSWYWLCDTLQENKIDVKLAHAKHLKAIAYAKVKTDKVDSKTLAELLRTNFIPSAHMISKEKRGLRDLMRTRLRFVRKRTSCYNSIHRIGEKFNCSMNDYLKSGSIPENLPQEYQLQIKFLDQQIELLNTQIKELEKNLQKVLVPNEDVQRLLMIPAFGIITSFSVYLEIDGIERFEEVKNFLSYSRVVPGAKDSNKTKKNKSGNKEGNVYLKIAFTDAAVHAVRYYPEIRDFYNKMRRRTNNAIARTLVAKELAKITYYILKEKTEYKGFKGKPISRQKSQVWPRLRSPRFGLDNTDPQC
ncbi:MAG TPA: IS110 family transposase [Ignavibacteria bacterium]|nr:IS110 family transposase [Ignavibacteria bacterium]HMR40910.1 IS110 family transposase [Ignavibacteria bacterium]